MATQYKIKPMLEAISETVQNVETLLDGYRIETKDKMQTLLVLEETLIKMKDASSSDDIITVQVSKSFKDIRLHLSCRGREIALNSILPEETAEVLNVEYGAETEGAIRDMILRGNSDRLRMKYRHGVNVVDILVARNKMAMMYYTFGAMLLGLAVGAIVRNVCPQSLTDDFVQNLFMPLYVVFLSAVRMVVAPLVFFSIAVSITGFGDMTALGRLGSRVFGFYIMTTAFAILIGLGLNALLQPGVPGVMELPGIDGATSDLKVSLVDTIVNIVPDNFVGTFVKADMLQIIFISVLVGVAVGKMGKHSQNVRLLIEQANDLFGSIIGIISSFLPFAVFGSLANLVATLDVDSFKPLMAWAGEVMLNILLVYVVYALILMLFGRLNPLNFFRKFFQASLTAFFTSSSNATIPTSMECCSKMGVQPRVYSFSIPLGATINMDGTSILFITVTLFLAGMYGIDVSGTTMASFILTTLFLSVSAPGVPGAATACLLLLFSIVGIPAEGLGVVIGICPVLELFMTMLNVTGDGAVTTTVASMEGLLDKDVFSKRS